MEREIYRYLRKHREYVLNNKDILRDRENGTAKAILPIVFAIICQNPKGITAEEIATLMGFNNLAEHYNPGNHCQGQEDYSGWWAVAGAVDLLTQRRGSKKPLVIKMVTEEGDFIYKPNF